MYTWSEFFFTMGIFSFLKFQFWLLILNFFYIFWKKYVSTTALILHQFQIRKNSSKFKDNFPTNISVQFSDISIGISNQNINSVCLDLERVKCKVAKKGLLGALFFFFKPSVLIIDCFAFRDFRRWHCWKHLVLLN